MLQSSSSRNSTIVRSQNMLRLARAALQTAYVVSESLGAGLAERLFTSPRRHPRPERGQAILTTGRPFDVDVVLRSPRWHGAHARVAAWRWGHGPAVLLVHGWEGRGSQLGAFVEPLVSAGFSVITFDSPGHGDSAGTRLYLTDHADVIADVVAAVGPLHAIVAHSFGAPAVLLAHSRHKLDVARNIMIAPNALIDDVLTKFAKTLGLDDNERDGFHGALAASSGLPLEALALERLVGVRDAALLVIHDREDREVPLRHADKLAATWPNAKLLLTDGLGHRRILRDDRVIAEIVAFARIGMRLPASDLVREVDALLSRP